MENLCAPHNHHSLCKRTTGVLFRSSPIVSSCDRAAGRCLCAVACNRPKRELAALAGSCLRGMLGSAVEQFMSDRNRISPAGLWQLLQLQDLNISHCAWSPVAYR